MTLNNRCSKACVVARAEASAILKTECDTARTGMPMYFRTTVTSLLAGLIPGLAAVAQVGSSAGCTGDPVLDAGNAPCRTNL